MPPQTPNFDPAALDANIKGQKAATLRILAEGGSHLAQQQALTQEQIVSSGVMAAQQASARASSSPAHAAQAGAAATAQSGYYAQVAANQAGANNTAMTNMTQANSNYMDQVSASIPALHAQTQRELNSMQHAAGQAQAERAMRQQMAQLELTGARERIAAAREDRAAARAEQEDPLAQRLRELNVRGKELDISTTERKLSMADEQERQIKVVSAIRAQHGPDSRTWATFDELSGVGDFPSALSALDKGIREGRYTTPGGKPLDRNTLADALARFYGVDPRQVPGQQLPSEQIIGGASPLRRPTQGGILSRSGR